MGDNLLNGGNEDKSQRQLEEVHGNRKFSSSSSNLSIAASHSSVAPKKVAIAVFMTIRFGGDGDAVFLFWDPKSEQFTRKCYAQFHKSLNFNVEFGKWFELKYLNVPDNELHIIVFDYEEIRPRAVTRVRDNLCAQFSTNRDRFINVWHTTFPCKEKNNYAEDKGWWPWLCRKCFPSLRELSPPTILELKEEQKVKEELTGSLEDLDKRMRHSFALEEEGNAPAIKDKPSFESTPRKEMAKKHQHMPIIQKLSINPQSVAVDRNGLTTVLAVLFTVREECGDAVFLIFNESKRMFTNQIYADKPEKIVGNPLVGHWYWMKYKSNCDIQDGKRINVNVIEVEEIKGNPPVETRVKYDGILAQFNTRQCYIKNWHKKIMHGKFANKESSDAPWWPNICFYCYPNANKNEDVNTAMANSSKWATGANALPVVRSKNWTTKNVDNTFTETSDSEAEEEMVEMDTVSKDGSGRSQMSTNASNNRSFTPISTIATAKSQSSSTINGTSMNNLNGININDDQQNIQPNSLSAMGLAQNEASKNSDNSQASKLTGGFGMGQPRRLQRMLANSTLSFARSNSPSIK